MSGSQIKKIRYRDRAQGVTRKSLQAAHRNLYKVGHIDSIIGYRVNGNEYVMVKGDKGTARFGGCSWSYSGEGPRGLAQIFIACGTPKDTALWLVSHLYRGKKDGVDWIINGSGCTPLSYLINTY